ncbi:MAG: DUF1054 family protein [Acidibacillus sp.]|uniref:Uncharacterized protein n=1 Tax=Sulfoacidibacillus ferrooxidans TaxID=2005001 RepID=A0A9X1V9C9_9BACL|nr:DUF1054 family protein [Sulfoacidibacillus ferrooxidans]MCI0182503.1 hypothetical protein [Sulfoacidibacillus ferrooxidans]MCY0894223.1 DUF1054 family protein [Acidibacillus sp.]
MVVDITSDTLTAPFTGIDEADFDVFAVPGLEMRMEALKAHLRPKLTGIGEYMAPLLSEWIEKPFYAHVAKHARRKTNPPNDSWVAFSFNQRGYKKWPTFMIGAWQTHVFVQFGVIYESPYKADFGRAILTESKRVLELLPSNYRMYPDHMKPEGVALDQLSSDQFEHIATRVIEKKNADLLFGISLMREEVLQMSGEELLDQLKTAMIPLAKLYVLTVAQL